MIWIKNNEEIIGCVPILKKKYTEDQIRQMSKYSCYSGWSNLSATVMNIQGINYEYHGSADESYSYEVPKTLAEVNFSFKYEFFWNPSYPVVDLYIKQVFDVFENLTLYKVQHYSEEQFKEKLEYLKRDLSYIVCKKTFSSIEYELDSIMYEAEENAKTLENVLSVFSSHNLNLSNKIFQEPDNSIIEKIYKKRRINEKLSF